MSDVVYQVQLNDKQVLDALSRIDKNISKIADRGSKEFEGIAKSANLSGEKIGAVAGIVSSITTEFINLAKTGIGALEDIGAKSIETALQVDTLKARLGGIFDGSKQAADEAFNFIQDKSKELGIDLSELAGAFIPKTENLAQFERVAKIATALARSDPEQGAIGARIALIEALSGTFTSLQRRFEIPKDDIKTLQEAFNTKGIEGFLTAFEEVLDKSGKSFEDLSNTAQAAFSKAEIAGKQFLGQLGTPAVEALKKQFEELNSTLNENEDDLALIADAFGRVLANVVDFIGTGINDIFKNLDSEQVTRIAEKFFDITEKARVLVETLSGADISAGLIDGIEAVANKLDEALTTAVQLNALSEAGAAKAQAEYKAWADEMERLHGEGTITTEVLQNLAGIPGVVQASNELAKLVGDTEAQTLAAKSAAAGQEAYNKVIQDAAAQLDQAKKNSQDNRQATDDMATALQNASDAGTAAADAIMAASQAEAQAAKDAEEFEAAQTKVNEKMAEAQKDFNRKLEDIDIETERKRLDIQIEFAQKRVDAAKDNLRKLEDIQKDYRNDVTDAAKDLERKEEDIARKFGQQRIDLEKENRQKRVDIEKDYRQTLQDIQSQFLIDAEEAEQKRDAVSFLRALKERNQKVQEAQVNRQREIDEQKTTNQQKLDDLRASQQRELEEARINNERKLEDLKTNLDRQIEAQNTAYARQLDDIATAEQRKNEELNRSRERDIEDAQKAYDRKLEDLRVALAAELALIEEYAAKMAAAQSTVDSATPSAMTQTAPRTESGKAGRFGRRASGGYFSGPTIVGENGPELINGTGYVSSNPRMKANAYYGQFGTNNVDNSRNFNLGLVDAGSLDSLVVNKIDQIMAQRLMQAV